MKLAFLKMHGLGNDFMVVREASTAPPDAGRIRRLADRREGVGFDQLLWVEPPRTPGTAAYYRVFNADGGEVGQCGNGLRCIARLLAEDTGATNDLRIESAAGIFEARVTGPDRTAVSMGEPRFAPAEIPFRADAEATSYEIVVDGERLAISALSMGNPHCVLQVEDVDTAPVATLGPRLEAHGAFPEHCNAGFLQVISRDRARLRVYERGVGETRACGTGACAAMVAGRRLGLFDERVRIALPGGELVVSWRGPGSAVWLEGPAEFSFEGSVLL